MSLVSIYLSRSMLASRLPQSLLRSPSPAHKPPSNYSHLPWKSFPCQFCLLFQETTLTIWNKLFPIHPQSGYSGFFTVPICGHLSVKMLELIWTMTLFGLSLCYPQWPGSSVTHLLLHSFVLSPNIFARWDRVSFSNSNCTGTGNIEI